MVHNHSEITGAGWVTVCQWPMTMSPQSPRCRGSWTDPIVKCPLCQSDWKSPSIQWCYQNTILQTEKTSWRCIYHLRESFHDYNNLVRIITLPLGMHHHHGHSIRPLRWFYPTHNGSCPRDTAPLTTVSWTPPAFPEQPDIKWNW